MVRLTSAVPLPLPTAPLNVVSPAVLMPRVNAPSTVELKKIAPVALLERLVFAPNKTASP